MRFSTRDMLWLTVDAQQIANPRSSILWLFSGALLIEISIAFGGGVSGIAGASATLLGVRDSALNATAVGALCVVFTITFCAVLRSFAKVASDGASCIRMRWIVLGILSVPIAAPFWGLCMIAIVERITQSESVRIATDAVIYRLVLTLTPPVTIGVPILLACLYRRSKRMTQRVTV